MVIMTLSPIFSAVISWVMFNEVLSILQIAGVLTTIGGVIAVIMVESRKTSEHTRPILLKKTYPQGCCVGYYNRNCGGRSVVSG